MELLNEEEYLNCYLSENQGAPIITHIDKIKGETFLLDEIYNQIIFLLKGKINFSYECQVNNIFEEGTFLMFPHGYKHVMDVKENSDIVMINMHNGVNFCNHFPLEMLYELNKSITPKNLAYSLKINEMIYDYLNTVTKTISDGLKCVYFQELKQRELFFYLRAYYPKKDLAAFFAPILNNDLHFSKLIYKNYESAKSVENLAALTNYSVSGFKKRFIKVFGISPGSWIEKEKAKKIYYEINYTQKTFKEISIEYDFSSTAHFDKFCKRVYGMSPGALRESTKQKLLLDI